MRLDASKAGAGLILHSGMESSERDTITHLTGQCSIETAHQTNIPNTAELLQVWSIPACSACQQAWTATAGRIWLVLEQILAMTA